MFARVRGREKWGVIANKHGISFGGNEKFLEFDNDDLQLCKYAKNHWILNFKEVQYVNYISTFQL